MTITVICQGTKTVQATATAQSAMCQRERLIVAMCLSSALSTIRETRHLT